MPLASGATARRVSTTSAPVVLVVVQPVCPPASTIPIQSETNMRELITVFLKSRPEISIREALHPTHERRGGKENLVSG
jgi:hypothetical protein